MSIAQFDFGDEEKKSSESEDTVIQPPQTIPEDKVEIVDELIDKPTTTPWVDSIAGYKQEDPQYQVGGMDLVNNYYQMNRESGDVSDIIDGDVDFSYQQYNKINNFVLNVQDGGVSYETDPESKEDKIVLRAIVTDGLVANRGDAFIFERVAGKLSLFHVTETTRLSPFNGSGYSLTAKLIEESSVNKLGKLLTELESKVIATYYYDPRYLYLGTKPILTEQEVQNEEDRAEIASRMMTDYLREFYDRQRNSLVLKEESRNIIYDAMLAKFVVRVFEGTGMIRIYEDSGINPVTIYDMMVQRRSDRSHFLTDTVQLAITNRLQDLQFLYGVQHTGITHLVRPKNARDDLSTPLDEYLGDGYQQMSVVEQFPTAVSHEPTKPEKLYPGVGYDDSYVLSKAYYSGQHEDLTLLERVIDAWLNKRNVNYGDIVKLVEATDSMTKVERFYLIPLIVFLLRFR